MTPKGSNMHVQGPQISQFNNIAPEAIPRSSFQRDHSRRTTFNADLLIPIFIDEILPGDDINVRMNSFTRMSTPIKPLMDNLYLETFWFFCPNRLVWSNWEKFQGQQTNPGDSVAYSLPVLNHAVAPMSTTGFTVESIYDYFGLPTQVTDLREITSLFNRMYDLTYNEWFRDENLQNSITVPTGDGPDNPALFTLRKRGKRKDYFTSGLPWPQKGDPVGIPIAGNAPIISTGAAITMSRLTDGTSRLLYQANPYVAATSGGPNTAQQSYLAFVQDGYTGNWTWGLPGTTVDTMEADFSELSAVTINQLRQAALYQQILELDARGGTRYVESIYSRFGVISPDFRLQRPELIGQGSTRINVFAVPQTAPTMEDTTPQGNLAAFGTVATSGDHGCRYSATEHGMVIGLLAIRADLTYQQGLPRMFTRRTRLDFYEPLLNGLGEQAVLNREIYAQGGADADLNVFAYQERFAEYRWKNSDITGKFRSTAPQSLDIWHASEEFENLPSLNGEFIESSTPMARILATGDTEPAFLSDMHFTYTHVRPMPIRSNPGITRL